MKLIVEIADTPSKQATGLMFRRSLGEQEGMLFDFKQPQTLSFWGVNTLIPLDIAFVRKDGTISEISTIHPLSDRLVRSNEDCTMAIEANLDFFKTNRISPGDKVSINREGRSIGSVVFEKNTSMKISQRMLDWDAEGEDVNYGTFEDITNQNDIQQVQPKQDLPVITPDSLNNILIDDVEEEEEYFNNVDQYEITERDIEQGRELDEPEYIPPDRDFPEFSSTQEALAWSEQNGESIHIWYQTKKGADIHREVEPHGTFHAETTGNNILVTFDRTAGDIRAFIIDNILYHAFSGNRFEPKFVVKD